MVSLVVLPGWYLSLPPSAHTEVLRVGGLHQRLAEQHDVPVPAVSRRRTSAAAR